MAHRLPQSGRPCTWGATKDTRLTGPPVTAELPAGLVSRPSVSAFLFDCKDGSARSRDSAEDRVAQDAPLAFGDFVFSTHTERPPTPPPLPPQLPASRIRCRTSLPRARVAVRRGPCVRAWRVKGARADAPSRCGKSCCSRRVRPREGRAPSELRRYRCDSGSGCWCHPGSAAVTPAGWSHLAGLVAGCLPAGEGKAGKAAPGPAHGWGAWTDVRP